MKKVLSFVILLTLIVTFSACESHTIIPLPGEFETYSESIQPIFENDCIDCHNGSRSPDLREGSSWNSLTNGGFINTDNPEESPLYLKLYGSHDSFTVDVNKETILGWIEAGAPND